MVRLVVLVIIAVLVLSFFGISIQAIVQSPAGQANFAFLWSLVVLGWDYLLSLLHAKAASLHQAVS